MKNISILLLVLFTLTVLAFSAFAETSPAQDCVKQKVEAMKFAMGNSYERASGSNPVSMLKVFPVLNFSTDNVRTIETMSRYPTIYANDIREMAQFTARFLDQTKDNLQSVMQKLSEIESCF
jgi:hypothetical protein